MREIRPVKRRVPLSELWSSWPVARIVALRDLKVKYKQSILGPAWLVLQPLGVLTGLVFVFRGVAPVDTGPIPYVLFALGSLSAWTFVQLSISSGTNVFIMNSSLISRVAFPRSSLFTAVLLGNLVPAAVILVIALIGLAIGRGLPLQILLLPLVAAWLFVFMAGVIFVTASLAVRYRDLYALVPFWLQVGLFLTPVGYPLESAPGSLRTILSLNPLTGLLELWRWTLFGTPVAALPIATAAVGTAIFVLGGWWVFTRMETRFADVI